ncbi:hypothetical protein EAG_16102, partial [Camponotus floridanus]
NSSIFVREFLARFNVTFLDHPSYFPSLVPCDFVLFLKVENIMRREYLRDIKIIKRGNNEILKNLSKELQHCFTQ